MNDPYTLSVLTEDKHQFSATLYPTVDPCAPVLIFFSALGTPEKVYRHFGKAMAMHGVQVCTPDWRGIGSSSVRASRKNDFGYRHLVEFDMASLIQCIRQRFPVAPIWIGGHSLGGQLAILAAAAQPNELSGVVMIASGSVHLDCYQGQLRFGVQVLSSLSGVVGRLCGYFPGSRIGFGGREATGLMHDWSHVAKTGAYCPAGSIVPYEQLMSTLCLPVLSLTFENDAWSPTTAAVALLNKLAMAQTVHWNWRAADTGGVALDHYSWIKKPSLVVPSVAAYIGNSG